jgi:hypothetical protein
MATVAAGVLVTASALVTAQSGATLTGTITDSSGAIVPGATVTVTDIGTHTPQIAVSDGEGHYAIDNLSAGRYDLTVSLDGFRPIVRRDLVVDLNRPLRVDAVLEIANVAEAVTVSVGAVQVDAASMTIARTMSSATMTGLALNGRSYTDLLAIQPGVAPVTTMRPDSIVMAGVTGAIQPSGQLNAGNVSISGQRESSNGFMLNGSSVQEPMNGGTAIVPNLDAIDRLRVMTSTFDPEYGNYNGGIVSVVTKSGADAIHGDVFDFIRNSALDSRNYFSPDRATFLQQQPGATIGGPIQKNRAYFFADYQATRTQQGIETGLIPVPTAAERAGDFSNAASLLSGSVNGPYWARLLSQRLGYAVSPAEPYYTSGCTTSTQCVFPAAVIPRTAWSAPAQQLLTYIPSPNSGNAAFSSGAFAQTVRDDKGSLRLDRHTGLGLISGYYFIDDYTVDNPYPTQQGGASVPGFNAVTRGRAQLFSLSASTTFATAVNEFHVSYLRNANDVGRPVGGLGVSVASQGFVTGPGTPGIVVQAPQLEGVENIAFNRFTMGVTTTGVNQVNNTIHASDAISREIGSHLLRVGGEFQYAQVNLNPNAQFNGTFSFAGSETGSDFADFLLGIPSTYIQAAGAPFHLRNNYVAAFAQDAWRARPNLTLNYGLRWDRIMPWYEADNQIQAIVPGQQSVVYPGAPTGLVFPGDAGIARTLAPVRNWNFAPRIGLAYAPQFESGVLHALFGDPDRSTVRASYGLFYTAFQGLSGGIMYSIPPFGYNYISPAPPLFDQPFITSADGTNNGQPFPHAVAPSASASHPATIDWSSLVPVNGDPYFSPDNQVPFTESYMVSLQRELTPHTTVSASYVGNQGHRLLVVQPVNPGDPALCLALSNPGAVAPGSATCGPFAENGVFTSTAGQVINGTRTALGPDYGSITAQRTIGRSQYNALELGAHYARGSVTAQAGYTYSKSMDTSSNLGEQVNPFDPMATWAPSAFDMRHNFVASYSYELPIDRIAGSSNWLTTGWTLSGTTRFSSGFPVTLYNDTDTSLLGTFGNGVNNHLLDTPNYTPNCDLRLNSDPSAGPAFNTGCFSLPALGQLGNAPRRFFYGPGIRNTDLALAKTIPFSGTRTLQLRIEAFNVFDRPQFYGAGSVDGNITSPTFGRIVAAAAPRLVQLAAKLTF